MNIKFLVVLILSVLEWGSVAADAVPTDDDQLIDLDDDDRGQEPLPRHHRALAASWWERIKKTYPNEDLKPCARRQRAPTTGDKCAKKAKTCFFETQECPSVGAHPMTKCTCDGKRPNNGKWTCVPEPCPVDTPQTGGEESDAGFYTSRPSDALNVKLNLLTEKVLDGYDNITELKSDIAQAARFYANSIIEEQSQYNDDPNKRTSMPVATSSPIQMAPPDSSPSRPSAAGATDYSTNNQEEGVDESDLVKSDGIYSYAAYGDIVVIWDAATGDFVAKYTLPPVADEQPPSAAPVVAPDVFTEPPPLLEGMMNENTTAMSDNTTEGDMPNFMPPFFNYQLKPVIKGMSLAAGRLVLYVQGYGVKIRFATPYASVLSNAYDTRIVILDTSTLPASIEVLSKQDIQGSFRDARSIGSDVHVVTTSYIDFSSLIWRLNRWNGEYPDLNAPEYKAKAVSIAEPLIDDFAASLLREISMNGVAPAIPKISLWQSDLGNNTNIVNELHNGRAIQVYVQLTSFSVQGLTGDATLSIAGAFTPSSWGYTYAIGGNLVFAAQGWNWSPWLLGSSQTTYLMGFKLDGASPTPAYLGSVDGYILNQYSLSVFEGHLRVATTVNTFWPVWQPLDGAPIFPERGSITNNTVHVLKIPTGTETVMKTVTGVPNLGKPGERLTAVRYFGDICYAGKHSSPCVCAILVDVC